MKTAAEIDLRVHIRWMIRRDFPEVLAIETAGFERPWREEDFLRVLRRRYCIGMVAEHGPLVAGFMVYELHRTKLRILNFCVHPDYLRQGVGRQMVAKLAGKLSSHRRTVIEVDVRESCLPAQLFYRALRFGATDVLRGHYDDGEDAYRFLFVHEEAEGLRAGA